MNNPRFDSLLIVFWLLSVSLLARVERSYYQEPSWKPRIFLGYDEVVRGNFWPASPRVEVSYKDPDFDESRLSRVPRPGIHPRVLITPTDLEIIRRKVRMGDQVPLPFRALWERVRNSQSPFYALVVNDRKLGRLYADQLVEKLHSLESKLVYLNSQPDKENIWSVDRSIMAQGEPDPPTEIWDLLEYDYLAEWMTPSERELARRVIAKVIDRRFSNFMMYPDHFMINNHQGFGMEYIRLMLLIEGEKGFNKELFERAAQKTRAMLDWFVNKDGMCYETIKGWLNTSVFVAVGLRKRDLLKHDHLRAKMRFFHAAMWHEDGKWKIRDEMRASAFHPIWLMHYYHPKDETIDFLYQASLNTNEMLVDATLKWPNPVGICNELLLLFAEKSMSETDGKLIDWNDQSRVDALNLPTTWVDDQRGYLYWRNSWKKGDMQASFQCKQDFFYGGHEGTETNRIILWKDGVNWIKDNDMLATKATFLQNMMTVDGKGCKWPPASSQWLGVQESAEGVTASADGRMGYSYTKSMQVHPFAYPSSSIPYYAPFAEGNWDLTRDIQVAFHPSTIRFNDGYAHTDYGPWSGETRLVEGYKKWNHMEQFFRTVHLGKGRHPYLLVIDDARKDSAKHLFDWNISVPLDVDLIEAAIPEIRFQNTDPALLRMGDLLLGKIGLPKDPKTGKTILKKGDPLCLIRVLWRNSEYGFPVPRFERTQSGQHIRQAYNQVVVPAISQSPEFRVLVYPYRHGDPLPITQWNEDRSALTISIGEFSDTFRFDQTDGGRTVYSVSRNDRPSIVSNATPARPRFWVRGQLCDAYDLRQTRRENQSPHYIFVRNETVVFERSSPSIRIHYTLDGSEPHADSPLYSEPLVIDRSCTLKARSFDPQWGVGDPWSATVEARLVATTFAAGSSKQPALDHGLWARIYEINTKPYNDKGFFDAQRVMLPDLNSYQAIESTTVSHFQIPHSTPQAPLVEQVKAFYRFNGWVYVPASDIYRFEVKSCGPITLDVADRCVIEHTGLFHQQEDLRKGEVALAEGWHSIELVVCDPLYWNINSLDSMPFSVGFATRGGTVRSIPRHWLCFTTPPYAQLQVADSVLSLSPLANVPDLEPGFDLFLYDRTDQRRNPHFLDIDTLPPFRHLRTLVLERSEGRHTVRAYNGYFYAPMAGVYLFDSPLRNGESEGLGGRQASCQNQIVIDSCVVVQRGVYGRNPLRKVVLDKGWYPISIRMGVSGTRFTVTLPDGQKLPLDGRSICRSVQPVVFERPAAKSIGTIDFSQWNGLPGVFSIKGGFQVWIAPVTKAVDTDRGRALLTPGLSSSLAAAVDVNVSRGTTRPGIKIHHLRLKENALAIALWFKSNQGRGSLFGKTGYNAFGKGYRTVSAAINNGRLTANPNRLAGGRIESDKWHMVVLSASEERCSLYLDGTLVAQSEGSSDVVTDALDLFLDHQAVVWRVELFDSDLSAEEVGMLAR